MAGGARGSSGSSKYPGGLIINHCLLFSLASFASLSVSIELTADCQFLLAFSADLLVGLVSDFPWISLSLGLLFSFLGLPGD